MSNYRIAIRLPDTRFTNIQLFDKVSSLLAIFKEPEFGMVVKVSYPKTILQQCELVADLNNVKFADVIYSLVHKEIYG